jgi:hypothetical protein
LPGSSRVRAGVVGSGVGMTSLHARTISRRRKRAHLRLISGSLLQDAATDSGMTIRAGQYRRGTGCE